MIALLREVADPGHGEGARWAGMRTHRIMSDALTHFGASSKLNAEWEFVSLLRKRGARAPTHSSRHVDDSESAPRPISTPCWRNAEVTTVSGLLGILIGLGLLIWFAFRGWSVLLLAPLAALDRGAVLPRSRCSPIGPKLSWAARQAFWRNSFRCFCLVRCSAS